MTCGNTAPQGSAGMFPVSPWKTTVTGFSVTNVDSYEYEGMDLEFYTGMHRPYYAATPMSEHVAASTLIALSATRKTPAQVQHDTYNHNHHSAASGKDTEMSEASEEVHAKLPVRSRARKPDRSATASQAHVDRLRAAAKKTANSKTKPTVKKPVTPRPASQRHAPKKAWKEEDPRGHGEHATTNHTLPHQGVSSLKPEKATRAAFPNATHKPLPPTEKLLTASATPTPAAQPQACLSKGEGGPCAVCYITNSPQWRNGRKGGRWSGQTVCNTCGTWEGRHPDEPVRAKSTSVVQTLKDRELNLQAYLNARIAALGVNIAALGKNTGNHSDAASDASAATVAPALIPGTSTRPHDVPLPTVSDSSGARSRKRTKDCSQPPDDQPAAKRHRL